MKLDFIRTDLGIEKSQSKYNRIYYENNIEVCYNNKYHIIKFNTISNSLKTVLKKELSIYLRKIKTKTSALIIGLGNENFTADSIGPKVLKDIFVNSYLENLDLPINGIRISALEPGVLGQTGIETLTIITSIVDKIKPDFLIIIDSFVSKNINLIEKSIQLTSNGITPGSGLMGINSIINKKTIGIPVIVIGVPTALETTIKKNKYILSTNRIDKYIMDIAPIISSAINEVLQSC